MVAKLVACGLGIVWSLCLVEGGEPNATGSALLDDLDEVLLDLEKFLKDYEWQKEVSQSEVELADAFGGVNRSLEAVLHSAVAQRRDDILKCVTAVEANAQQTVDGIQEGLERCHQQMDEDDNGDEVDSDGEDELAQDVADLNQMDEDDNGDEVDSDGEDELAQDVADLNQVIMLAMEEIMGKENAQHLQTYVSERSSKLVRRFENMRVRLRKCVDQQLEAAYQHSDRLVDAAADCKVLAHHEEL